MTADTDQPTLAVTQADREAAAGVAHGFNRHILESGMRTGMQDHHAIVQAFARHRTNSEPRPAGDLRGALADRFWLIVREPGMVPDRKGPWPHRDTAKVMREFIAARPRAFLDVLTIGPDGTPDVQHGPEALQMADARSMTVGSKHNARVRAAADEALATHSPAPMAGEGWQDIETVNRDCMTEIDMWCASAEADGEGWNLRGILMIGTPDWIKREDASDYFPHENGGFLTHWRPLPAPPAAAHPSTQGV